MKLKFLLKLVEMILGESYSEEYPRADMYLPVRALAMSLIYLAGGTAFGIWAYISPTRWAVAVAVLGIGLGLSLFLCWKNQTIRIISEEEFVYTTMFGKSTTYRFADIQALHRNPDSQTLYVAGKKCHMEAMAILSDRLVHKIDKELNRVRR